MTPADPLSVAVVVATVLEEIGIRYVIGGSVASSLIGEPRSTLDLDIMIDIDVLRVRQLAGRLRDNFYIDEESAVGAVHSGSSFNAIHLSSSLKVDFFPAEREAFAREQLERRRPVLLDPPGVTLYFYAAEDLIVRKLMWFRAGGAVSDRQWRDVLGMLKAGEPALDFDLLRTAAAKVNAGDLLERVLREAGRPDHASI